jgi:hypothetical protein
MSCSPSATPRRRPTCCYPYALDWADEHLPAVVWTSYGGQETGRALAAVLLGGADPAGRLPQTWSRGDDEFPHPLDHDVIKAAWIYQYHRTASLYPFGRGLSYTDFAQDDLRLSTATVAQDGTLDVTVTLSNTGTRSGSEVVKLYVRALDARYEAPRMKLADFRKVRLEAGESRELVFRLAAEQLAHWDVTGDPGAYEVHPTGGRRPAPGLRLGRGRRAAGAFVRRRRRAHGRDPEYRWPRRDGPLPRAPLGRPAPREDRQPASLATAHRRP